MATQHLNVLNDKETSVLLPKQNKQADRKRRSHAYSFMAAHSFLKRCAGGISDAERAGNLSLREIWSACAVTVSGMRRTLKDQANHIKKLKRQLAAAHAQLAEKDQESITDELTGFGNRRYFNVMLDNAVKSASREGSFSVIMADVDGMKMMNDKLGHPFVDEVLKLFAVLMRQSVREGDAVTRWAGDEFGAVLKHCPLEKAAAAAERLRASFAIAALRLGLPCSASLGVFSSDGSSPPEHIIKRTDWALYIAKAGKIEADGPSVSIEDPKNTALKNRVSTAVARVDMYGHETMTFTVRPHYDPIQSDTLKAQVESALQQFPVLWERAARMAAGKIVLFKKVPANDEPLPARKGYIVGRAHNVLRSKAGQLRA